MALGLRFAILDGLHWRAALVRAWDLARSNLADVALLYLIIMGILIAASLACAAATLVVVFAGALAGGLAYATGATATSAPMISIAVITGLVLLAGYLLFVVIVVVWQSVTWTVFWRRLTAPAPVPVTDGASGLPHEEGAAV